MPRRPSRPYPVIPVKEAATIPDAIRANNAGKPMNRLLLAEAMDLSPSSTKFRDLITASGKYGFTRGSYAAETIVLTDLGEQLTKPRSQEERLDALRKGMRNIPLFERILVHFNNNRLPAPEFLANTLERDPFEVNSEWATEASVVFSTNGQEVGFIRTISNAPHVILEAGFPTVDYEPDGNVIDDPIDERTMSQVELDRSSDMYSGVHGKPGPPEPVKNEDPIAPQNPISADDERTPPERRQFFIAHGWDEEALKDVQAILNKFSIPFVVAREEPNSGRPISQKIRDLMKSCSAGIFIFSADEEFKDKDGNTIWRPRENVVFELGAGSLEYEQRIVILKDSSVYFPTDFRDIGYIEYEKGNLQAKAMELISELIAFGALRLTP